MVVLPIPVVTRIRPPHDVQRLSKFKGEQRIEFPADSGVSIIYGENMRGKTTLLNAIRYALFGKVMTRGATQVALHQMGNWETAKEKGKYGFKVVLEFEHEGQKLSAAPSPAFGR